MTRTMPGQCSTHWTVLIASPSVDGIQRKGEAADILRESKNYNVARIIINNKEKTSLTAIQYTIITADNSGWKGGYSSRQNKVPTTYHLLKTECTKKEERCSLNAALLRSP